MKKIVLLLLFCGILVSCQKTASITVTNKVSNCKLENISFGDYKIGSSIITNESTAKLTVKEKKRDFPKKHPLKFYIIANGNRVILQTVEEFELSAGENLEIIVDNSTQVKTP